MSNYNKQIYYMYEEEVNNNKKFKIEIKELKLENKVLKQELNTFKNSFDNKLKVSVEKVTSSFSTKIDDLNSQLDNALNEIERLKNELKKKDDKNSFEIDKLKSQVNKNSSNSSIPTSKEMINNKNKKTGANTYNHRVSSGKSTGGQLNHKGSTLTKDIIEKQISENNLEVREYVHHINGPVVKTEKVKYKVGLETKVYVEKHIYVYRPDATDKLPKSFYSDVTYNDDLKALVVSLGNSFNVPYNKIQEFLGDLTNGVIDISQGTIDNIYNSFDNNLNDTLYNIEKNIINGKYQHTDETTTKENGKEVYYRAYANDYNVLYKYHHRKGDIPIEEDGILVNYFGTIISDHEVGIFKYGINNQDCIIHLGRYCMEKIQNVYNISWPMDLYRFLLRIEFGRKILIKYGQNYFTLDDIKRIEEEYDAILNRAKEENKEVESKYWREKCNTLLNRCIKYKKVTLYYIHDFTIPYDNNFIERAIRMIKGKTKVSGGFRSENGGNRFGRIMSIIKTARLRKLNPFECIKALFAGQTLFA